MATFKICRYFMDKPTQVIARGKTEQEVREHCKDPESSSTTCSDAQKDKIGHGTWFDGYEQE